MHNTLLNLGYGLLAASGVLHFIVDVLLGKRAPSPETTLFNGLHTALSLGELFIAVCAFVVMASGSTLMSTPMGAALGIGSVAVWLGFCFSYVDVWPPRLWLMTVIGVLIAAAATTPLA